MSDIEKLIWLGVGVAGVAAAGTAFSTQLSKVEKTPTIVGFVLLAGLGLTFLSRLEDTAGDARNLLS